MPHLARRAARLGRPAAAGARRVDALADDALAVFQLPKKIGVHILAHLEGRERAQRRRAQKLCLPYEVFEDPEIFERDQWICGLCDGPVDKTLRWPDPQSPSLDHILPLSRGGHHARENCQLAHLRCNLRKNNRIVA